MSDNDIENLRQDYRQLISLVMQAVEGTKENAVGIKALDNKIISISNRLTSHMDDEEEKIELTGLRIEALTAEVKNMRDLCVDGRHCDHHEWVEEKLKWKEKREQWFTETGMSAVRLLTLGVIGLVGLWLSEGFFIWLAQAVGG